MKRVRNTVIGSLLAFSLAGVGAVASQGCSSSTTAGASTSSAATKRPPEKPSATTSDTSTRTFAVNKLYLGDAPRGGSASSDAWKKFGYDLDGKISTRDSTDVCKLVQGAPKSYREDGDQGIDNSFGANLLSTLTNVAPSAATDINSALTNGSATVLLTITGLSDDPKQSASGLKGYLNAGANLDPNDAGVRPTFGPTQDWPVRPDLLSDTKDPKSSKVQFPDSYVNNGTWVNGSDTKVSINMSFGGTPFALNIYKAVITFDHTAPDKATNGTIGGILKVEDVVTAIQQLAVFGDTKYCDQSQLKSILDAVRQVADIMSDGSQDPNTTCDGVSIGLGFEAVQIANPTKVADPSPPSADPCSAPKDAGATD